MSRKRAKEEAQIQTWREEIQAILDRPMSDWGSKDWDRVEELAGHLGYTDDDCNWRSF